MRGLPTYLHMIAPMFSSECARMCSNVPECAWPFALNVLPLGGQTVLECACKCLHAAVRLHGMCQGLFVPQRLLLVSTAIVRCFGESGQASYRKV